MLSGAAALSETKSCRNRCTQSKRAKMLENLICIWWPGCKAAHRTRWSRLPGCIWWAHQEVLVAWWVGCFGSMTSWFHCSGACSECLRFKHLYHLSPFKISEAKLQTRCVETWRRHFLIPHHIALITEVIDNTSMWKIEDSSVNPNQTKPKLKSSQVGLILVGLYIVQLLWRGGTLVGYMKICPCLLQKITLSTYYILVLHIS